MRATVCWGSIRNRDCILYPGAGTVVLIRPAQTFYERIILSFRSDSSGVVRLELEEAGDSTTIQRDDIRRIGADASLEGITLSQGTRTTVDITADAPIGQRAWRLRAVVHEDD